jgi:predicted O-methyltransferase YrrM
MRFDAIAAAVGEVPFMTPVLGRRVYDHIIESRAEQVLELGTAHGVGAAYMAAALEEQGAGHVTTVDYAGADFNPSPAEILERAGLAHRVTIIRAHSSYNWFLKQTIEQCSDAAGNCRPTFDFCYLDGSKNFNIDGLAIILVEKLLKPGGWLLMDDLEWTYERNPWIAPTGDGRPLGPLSESERTEPHLLAVFKLIVAQHPSFTRLIHEDAWYGWAQKAIDQPREYELRTSRPLSALIATELRRRRWRVRS